MITPPGCSLIYEPKGRAREYAALACNVYRGCAHRCLYCYAPTTKHMTRTDFATVSPRGDDFLTRLDREAAKYETAGRCEQVLLCFTCDPYPLQEKDLRLTRQTIEILHAHKLSVQVLTKGGMRAWLDRDLFTPADAYAATLTFADANGSKQWEPGAALPDDRIQALRLFYNSGIRTWASLEPVIEPEQTLELIRRTHPFVDLYKVGKLNYHPHERTIDWRRFAIDVVRLLKETGRPYIIKSDLAGYLPREMQAEEL